MPLALAFPTEGRCTHKTKPETKIHKMKLVLTLTALLASASLVLAADEPKKPGERGEGKRPNPEEFFKKLDTNADGSVSKDEYLAGPRAKQDPAKGAENFGKLDKDNDGKLTKDEFAAMAKGKRDGKGDAPKKAAEGDKK